jgi:hypothetical protein
MQMRMEGLFIKVIQDCREPSRKKNNPPEGGKVFCLHLYVLGVVNGEGKKTHTTKTKGGDCEPALPYDLYPKLF